MDKKTNEEYYDEILNKMFSYVGITLKDVKPKESNWFLEYSWTAEQQEEFTKWLSDYLYNDKGARGAIMANSVKSKKKCDAAANFFVFSYGWRLKNE